MTPIQQMIAAVLTSSAFTGAVLELIRMVARWLDKRKNRGMSKLISDIDYIRTEAEKTNKEVDHIGKRLDHQRQIDKVLLHDAIHAIYKELKDAEYITLEDKANLDYIFEEYQSLNGNHKAEAMYQILSEKPIKGE